MDVFEWIKFKIPNEWDDSLIRKEFENFLQTNWKLRNLFYDDDCKETSQQFLKFYATELRSNNYIGTILFKGIRLNIFPKIFKVNESTNLNKIAATSDELNRLMQINLNDWFKYYKDYWPRYVNIKSDFNANIDNFKELYIIIFIRYLRSLLNKSGYFQNEERTQDLPYITGHFDVQDYVCKKILNAKWTKFKCTYSSFEFDNLLNQIIKYTCRLLSRETDSDNSKLELHEIISKLSDVSDFIFTYHDCDKVIIDKMHQDYQIVLSMCKMFLLNKTLSFTNQNNKAYCFLFPTEKLFEKFIGEFVQEHVKNVELQTTDKKHLINYIELNDNQINDSACFSVRPNVIYSIDNKKYILDTKYKEIKRLENNVDDLKKTVKDDIKQSDLYQMIAYALKWNTNKVCLIYPQYLGEEVDSIRPILKFEYGNNQSIAIQIARVHFAVQDENDILKRNQELENQINNILEINN